MRPDTNPLPHIVILFIAIVLCASPASAQSPGPENILVRNVTLIDPTGKTEDRVVNILINHYSAGIMKEFGFRVSKDCRSVYIYPNQESLSRYPFLVDPECWFLMKSGEDT